MADGLYMMDKLSVRFDDGWAVRKVCLDLSLFGVLYCSGVWRLGVKCAQEQDQRCSSER